MASTTIHKATAVELSVTDYVCDEALIGVVEQTDVIEPDDRIPGVTQFVLDVSEKRESSDT